MSEEAMEVQIRLMKNIIEAGLDIEKNGVNHSAENKMFFIDEDIEQLKVFTGENNVDFKKMIKLKETIELKIKKNKDSAQFY